MGFGLSHLLLTFVISYSITAGAFNTCSIKDITAVTDFDVRKFAGPWLTFLSLPSEGRSSFDRVVKWWMLYTNSETVAFRVLIAEQLSVGNCSYTEAKLLNTSTPGKFILQRTTNNTVSSTLDVWVTDTDYLSYAVIYGCGLTDTSGDCTIPYTQVLAREGYLTSAQVEAVVTSLSVLCLNETWFDVRNISQQTHVFPDCALPPSFKEFNASGSRSVEEDRLSSVPSQGISSDRKVFAIVAGIVAGVILLFGGAFLVDKYWKPNYTALK